MGVVWSAYDEVLKDAVALKFLPDVVAKDAIAVDELKQETRRAHRLTHAHIVRVHDFLQHAEIAAVCMELIDGANLTQLRLQRPNQVFTTTELTPWVIQLCEALQYAHGGARIVHRDLKPANILVTREGLVKVTDFGISRSLTETQTRLTLPKNTSIDGTLPYMSPQQLLGEKPLVTDDVYSLGASLYDLLTGKPPFYRGDAPSLMAQIRHRAPTSLAERRSELGYAGDPIPARWNETILRCLAKNAFDRPQSTREILERLELKGEVTAIALAERGPNGRAPTRDTPIAESSIGELSYRRKRITALGMIAIALVLAAGVRWLDGRMAERRRQNARVSQPATQPLVRPEPFTVPKGDVGSPAATQDLLIELSPPDVQGRLWFGALADASIKGGTTLLTQVRQGTHELTVRAPGYETFSRNVVVSSERRRVNIVLVPTKGALEITGRPGTTVESIDSRREVVRVGSIGPSGNLTIENLVPSQIYTLRLRHPECEAMELKGVEVGSGRLTKLAALQTPLPAPLTITSSIPDAEIRINGSVVGKTPTLTRKVPTEQPLLIVVTRPGFQRAERTVTLSANRPQTCDFGALLPELGGIIVHLKDPNIALDGMTITVDRQAFRPVRAGGAWQILGVPAGLRTIEISSGDYVSWRERIMVPERRNAEVDVTFTPKSATMDLSIVGPSEFTVSINGEIVPVVNNRVAVPSDVSVAVQVRAKGFRPVLGRVTLAPNSNKTLELKMERQPLPKEGEFHENSLQMKFAPVPGTKLLFSIWETRLRDFDVFLYATKSTSRQEGGNPTEPKILVTWADARAFCEWLTLSERLDGNLGPDQCYRLPTDAEWSMAAELGSERGKTPSEKSGANRDLFPWGKQWPPPSRSGNYAGTESESRFPLTGYHDGYASFSPVGRFNPNRFGLYDLGGNVAEWCEDEIVAGSKMRVTRGASFADDQRASLLASFRGRVRESHASATIGFRCILETGSSK